jgi:radical SAM protein with 4Fe4S-binding SPASM domain
MGVLHRFEHAGRRYVIDQETCFCFECDAVSWDVLEHYPDTPPNRIRHLLADRHDPKVVEEVLGELSWLRASKSILQPPDVKQQYEGLARGEGLRELVLLSPAPDRIAEGTALLFARAGAEQTLRLELRWESALPPGLDGILRACAAAFRTATIAGKSLQIRVRVDALVLGRTPQDLAGHRLAVAVEAESAEDLSTRVEALAKGGLDHLGRMAKALHDPAPRGRIVLEPGHADLAGAVACLDQAGFAIIELEVERALARPGGTDAGALLEGLREAAVYYAERLLAQHYFRLDPIAGLFWRIHNGTPIDRHDPAGVGLLCVAPQGDLFASPDFAERGAPRLGRIDGDALDEAARGPYLDLGVRTTPECMRCWARHLCGGGSSAVHAARTGQPTRPDPAWCDAQRAWLQTAVAAFSLLSAQGVNFSRVYQNLTPQPRPSLWTLAKAAFRMQIGMRPLAEADAPLLARWESWNDAAYFTAAERGMMIATRYDREMDALHPSAFEHEFLLLRRDGQPMGLLRLRPESAPGAARLWIYLRDEKDYTSEPVRRSFRHLLGEAAKGQQLRRLVVPVGPAEAPLAEFLAAAGFTLEGEQREALYLHGRYHNLRIYGVTLGE